ncbi:hypothetical protein [Phenylobacterium sp.]|uniref:hypothetical protein n=1 Tax=Phenylobacterium sp. TaxID=1871053 RepID=UPI0027362F55|nr:hypothetical protein [Phenylobacterium sp.]MDP3853164.1 hypothetical protein [Phenylobacterium sp.]
MGKSHALSNRKRRLALKGVPKPARAAGLTVTVAAKAQAEPKGMAARVAQQDEVAYRQAGMVAQALREDAVGEVGPLDPRQAVAEEFGVEVVDGRIRIRNRDGLALLHRAKGLTDDQAKGGLAFRLCYEAQAGGLASGLGNAGQGGGGRKVTSSVIVQRSAAELHRVYILARLNQMERAVNAAMVDGRELHALRMIAGEGRTVREIAGSSGHAREAYRAALVRALDAIVQALRIAGH